MRSDLFPFLIAAGFAIIATWPSSAKLDSNYNIGTGLHGFILTENQTQNNPPQVKITLPKDGAKFGWNSLVRYSIAVSDVEDGKSEYAEIPTSAVFLETIYLPSLGEAKQYLEQLSKSNRDLPGLALIKSSICFTCHADKTRLVGPSWAEVAERYSSDPTKRQIVADHIISGSSGIWSDVPNVQMPPNPTMTRQQSLQIVDYVLQQGANQNRSIYPGIEGTFRSIEKPANNGEGVYVLTASYTDRGINQDPQTRKRGQHSVILNPLP